MAFKVLPAAPRDLGSCVQCSTQGAPVLPDSLHAVPPCVSNRAAASGAWFTTRRDPGITSDATRCCVSQGEEELPKAIILDLADHLFLLTGTADASDAVKAEAKDKAMELIKQHSACSPTPRSLEFFWGSDTLMS